MERKLAALMTPPLQDPLDYITPAEATDRLISLSYDLEDLNVPRELTEELRQVGELFRQLRVDRSMFWDRLERYARGQQGW
jgi:hypothetical protein